MDFDAVLAENGMSTLDPVTFGDSIDFWLNNLDPQSLSFLRVRVMVTAHFWCIDLRNFIRVNGVMARVVETRLLCRADNQAAAPTQPVVGSRAAAADSGDGSGAASLGGQCMGGRVVLRERSWREGSWDVLAGKGASPYCFLGGRTGGLGDDVAVR